MKQTVHSTKWRKLHMHYFPKECKPFSKDVITPGESILKHSFANYQLLHTEKS